MSKVDGEKAFKKLQKSLERIQKRTERDVQSAVDKFKKGCKDDKLAFSPPIFELKMPKLYLLTED